MLHIKLKMIIHHLYKPIVKYVINKHYRIVNDLTVSDKYNYSKFPYERIQK